MNNKDLDLALNMCIYNYEQNYFDKIYPFTTENLSGYIQKNKFKNKKVLTVGSSIDQIFNLILADCKEMTLFDINPFIKYYYDLKSAAIKVLTLDEFINFFIYFNYPNILKCNNNYFNKNILEKLNKELPEDSYIFWNTIRTNFSNKIIATRLFSTDVENIKTIKKLNNYLSEENYNKLKKLVGDIDITFITSDIKNINEKINKIYDIILLSNISSLCLQKDYNNSLIDFKKDILKLENHLSENGLIYIAYLYNYTIHNKYKFFYDSINNIELVNKIFNNNIIVESFIGAEGLIKNDLSIKDTVLIYKRKK